MANHDIIVVGASAGGVEALSALVAGLPADLPAAVCIVLHIPPTATSMLPAILTRIGRLPAHAARDGEPILPGQIYIAPPDHHLLLTPDALRVVRGPHENRHRPAIDPLFRTAARFFGPRVVGVVLTGALNDGTAGLLAIKRRGGVAVAQDPATALFPSMPESACRYVAVDYCLPLNQISTIVTELAAMPAPAEGAFPVSDELRKETDLAGLNLQAEDTDAYQGTLTALTCPECKGPIWEIHDDELVRYRCRVGHAFTADAMLEGLSEAVETALWVALNTLEESAQMLDQLASDARARQHEHVAQQFTVKAQEKHQHIQTLRQLLLNGGAPTSASIEAAGE